MASAYVMLLGTVACAIVTVPSHITISEGIIMRVLVTGAGGHIGAAVVSELVGAGHRVTGLVRSDASAQTVGDRGGSVLPGDVGDLELLGSAARESDAVIHLAFDNAAAGTGGIAEAAEADLAVVRAVGDALEGTGKTLIGIGIASTGDPEADRQLEQMNPRTLVAREILSLTGRGIRPLLIGVPPVTHSDRDRSGFIPIHIGIARRQGVSGYVATGQTHWPAVHTVDLAHLIRLALEKAPAGSQIYGAAESAILVRDIAASLGAHLDLPVRSIPEADADAHFAPFPFMSYDIVMPTEPARELRGWVPSHLTLLEDLEQKHYYI